VREKEENAIKKEERGKELSQAMYEKGVLLLQSREKYDHSQSSGQNDVRGSVGRGR